MFLLVLIMLKLIFLTIQNYKHIYNNKNIFFFPKIITLFAILVFIFFFG